MARPVRVVKQKCSVIMPATDVKQVESIAWDNDMSRSEQMAHWIMKGVKAELKKRNVK